MDEIRRIIRKNIDRLILNETTQYLFERWSHSDEIDKEVERIFDTIGYTARKSEWMTVIKNKLYLIKGIVPITIFGLDIELNYFMYVASDDETANRAINECYAVNGLSDDEKKLIITIYTVNGEVLERVSNRNVYHEVEHLFQIANTKKNNPDYISMTDRAYEQSVGVLGSLDNQTEEDRNIAILYYYSNPHEQDSFMNEYYYDLVWMRQHLFDRESHPHSRLKDYEDKIKWYFANNDDEKVKYAVAKYRGYGMPKRNFEVMINKGLARFKRKMNNVEKNFKERSKKLNECNVFSGLRTRHGSLWNML